MQSISVSLTQPLQTAAQPLTTMLSIVMPSLHSETWTFEQPRIVIAAPGSGASGVTSLPVMVMQLTVEFESGVSAAGQTIELFVLPCKQSSFKEALPRDRQPRQLMALPRRERGKERWPMLKFEEQCFETYFAGHKGR